MKATTRHIPDPTRGIGASIAVMTIDGKEYTLLQDAYPENDGDTIRYYARATDADGAMYLIAWDTTPEWDRHIIGDDGDCVIPDCDGYCEDPSNACDWDSPVSVVES